MCVDADMARPWSADRQPVLHRPNELTDGVITVDKIMPTASSLIPYNQAKQGFGFMPGLKIILRFDSHVRYAFLHAGRNGGYKLKVQDAQISYAPTRIDSIFHNPAAPESQSPNASVSKSQYDGLMQVKITEMRR